MLMLLLSEVSNNALVFIFVAFFKVQVQMSIRTIIVRNSLWTCPSHILPQLLSDLCLIFDRRRGSLNDWLFSPTTKHCQHRFPPFYNKSHLHAVILLSDCLFSFSSVKYFSILCPTNGL